MNALHRRRLLAQLAVSALPAMALPSWGQAAKPATAGKPKAGGKLAAKLRIVIPANACLLYTSPSPRD